MIGVAEIIKEERFVNFLVFLHRPNSNLFMYLDQLISSDRHDVAVLTRIGM